MASIVYSAHTNLIETTKVSIETNISHGAHSLSIVGLPDKTTEECLNRIVAAIKHTGFNSPKQKAFITLSPAVGKKDASSFDLAVALSYLAASNTLSFNPEEKIFLGELNSDGSLRPIKGVLPITCFAVEEGMREMFVPKENAKEAALIGEIAVYGADTLEEVIAHLKGEKRIERSPKTTLRKSEREVSVDFSDVRAQHRAKRGLLIAAAGGHNVCLFGPPGTEKTTLAKAFAGILPELTYEEALIATSIHSIAGTLPEPVTNPPFRAPRYTASHLAVIGGGSHLKPGEITLAHTGVLFMDEFPEFDERVLESLREPLEEKTISFSHTRGTGTFPANFILVTAMKPCPCGNYGFKGDPCSCTPNALEDYRKKLSIPVMDRIDIWLDVDGTPADNLSNVSTEEKSDMFRRVVEEARTAQSHRYKERTITKNADMNARDIVSFVTFTAEAQETLNTAATRLGISPRMYHRLAKVARTIADLEKSECIHRDHILEAIEYRPRKFEL